MSKVRLITASASGLGRNIAEAVLASGDRLVATACDPGRLEDLVKKYGDQVRTAPLDVADQAAAYVAVNCWRWRKDRKKTRPAGRHFCGI
jgi:NADP-dependent 3-hydroxy acid dehydrogenase YdfG